MNYENNLPKLEQDILNIYKDGMPFNNQMSYMASGLKTLLHKRKYMINFDLKESSYSPLLGDLGLIEEIEQFSKTLELFLKQSYETFKTIVEEKLDSADMNSNNIFELSVYMSRCPESMSIKNEYGNSLWNIFNDKAFNGYECSPSIQNKLFEMTSIGYKEVDDKLFQEAMELTHPLTGWGTGELALEYEELEVIKPVETLIKQSCFAITDFAYCRDFRAEIKLILGY